MRVRIFGAEIFESKWIHRPRGWIAHRFFCDGQIAVHDVWLDKGYKYAVLYDHAMHPQAAIMDWCQTHSPSEYLIHPSGAVLFTSSDTADQFKALWSPVTYE